MNLLNDKTTLRSILRHWDLANTVNGGTSYTHFNIDNSKNSSIVRVKNHSVAPEAFKFVVKDNQLIIDILHFEKQPNNSELYWYPIFYKNIVLPYFVDISRIEAFYQNGEFKILLPYHKNYLNKPYELKIKNINGSNDHLS